jgi:hypothetical protein
MRNRSNRHLIVAPFVVIAAMMSFAVAAYACTYYVGLMSVWGSVTGTTSGSEVRVTGSDNWGSDSNGPMTQGVSSITAKAQKYTSGSTCGTNRGCFYVSTGTGGIHASFNETTSDIWYDVNTIPVGYTSHTTWGGDPNYDCMDWNTGSQYGVRNVGSVKIPGTGSGSWGLITQATNATQGTGSSVTVASNVAGPFYIATNETSNNTGTQESGVCLSDSSSINGDQAPLKLAAS